MKRWFLTLLATILIFNLVACNNNKKMEEYNAYVTAAEKLNLSNTSEYHTNTTLEIFQDKKTMVVNRNATIELDQSEPEQFKVLCNLQGVGEEIKTEYYYKDGTYYQNNSHSKLSLSLPFKNAQKDISMQLLFPLDEKDIKNTSVEHVGNIDTYIFDLSNTNKINLFLTECIANMTNNFNFTLSTEQISNITYVVTIEDGILKKQSISANIIYITDDNKQLETLLTHEIVLDELNQQNHIDFPNDLAEYVEIGEIK